MAASKHIDLICVIVTVLTLLLTLLFMNGAALGLEAVSDGDREEGYFTDNDLNGEWDGAGAQKIALTGDGADITGGAYFVNGAVHIVSAGRYVLTGELEGSLIVEATNSDKIWLRLEGVSIDSPDGAAIDVEQAEKVFLTLSEGTENTISSRAFSDASSGVDGAIYSRDDLTLNGSGSLTVDSAGHGIVCNDDLVFTGGTISVKATEDGVHANDSVRICNAEITIEAGDDGVTVSNDQGTGYFYMESGVLSIPSCCEGVEGQEIVVAGGEISVYPTDDGFNAKETTSAIRITGGSVRVVNETGRDADGLDSNGSIYVSGGTVFVSMSDTGGSAALDAGTESGGVCQVIGGTVVAAGAAAMAEGFDASSTQGFVTGSFRGSAGARVTLADAQGQVLIDETIPCAFSSLILSAPGMENGDTVTLTVDGEATEMTVDTSAASGFGGMGGMGGMFGGFGGRGQRPGGFGDTTAGEDAALPDGGTAPTEGDSENMTPPDGNFGDMTPSGGGIDETAPTDGNFGDMTPPGGDIDETAPTEGNFGGMTAPEDGGSGFFNRGNRGDMRLNGDQGVQTGPQADAEAGQTAQGSAPAPADLLLTLVSALVLAAGILIAVKVRH